MLSLNGFSSSKAVSGHGIGVQAIALKPYLAVDEFCHLICVIFSLHFSILLIIAGVRWAQLSVRLLGSNDACWGTAHCATNNFTWFCRWPCAAGFVFPGRCCLVADSWPDFRDGRARAGGYPGGVHGCASHDREAGFLAGGHTFAGADQRSCPWFPGWDGPRHGFKELTWRARS